MLRWLKISFNVAIIAAILIVTFIWFRKNDAFVLKSVKISGNQVVTRQEILELANVDFSKEIFKIETDKIRGRIMAHPMVKSASVNRFLPAMLRIHIEERNLIAVISGSEMSAVDENGLVISQFPASAVYDLPIITGFNFKSDSPGERNSGQSEIITEMFYMVKMLKACNLPLYHEISEIHYQDNYGVVLYFKNLNLPVIFGNDDFHRKVIYFSTIYHHLLKQKQIHEALAIDVRFKNQVVIKHKS